MHTFAKLVLLMCLFIFLVGCLLAYKCQSSEETLCKLVQLG